MYRCQVCNAVIAAGTRATRIVTETRPAEYPNRAKAHRTRVGRKTRHFDDPGGAGYEIAKEKIACPVCASAHEAKQAEAAANF